ncbi:MAG: hypothetical protein ACKOET_05105, partial [Verrucomicrobiota bacterium]
PGFALMEWLGVLALLAVLAGGRVPALGQARETARSAVGRDNLRQLVSGAMNHVADHADHLPWCGGVDRHLGPDWVFGGRAQGELENPRAWRPPGLGFHAEAGSLFPHVTGHPPQAGVARLTIPQAGYRGPGSGPRAAVVPGGTAAGGTWVRHHGEVNAGCLDAPVEGLRHQPVRRIQDRARRHFHFHPYL